MRAGRRSTTAAVGLPLRSLLTLRVRTAATLCEYGQRVLTSPVPEEKARLTHEANERWRTQAITDLGDIAPPPQPARPPTPELRDKRNMPGAKELNVPLPIYLLHSLAHIELNAVDLGWDLILRFRHENMPPEFYTDWVSVLSDEARHFGLLSSRLVALGYHYGVIPAHDSLLRDGETTGHNLKARLAIIALVHETHGLDSWERLVQRFNSNADKESGRIVDTICREEIDHVKKGLKWFRYLCERDDEDPETAFQAIVHQTQIPVCATTAYAEASTTSQEAPGQEGHYHSTARYPAFLK
ncbi:uncharacterized protein ACA1_140210 [Acanthamoeba castellanii str. Neff]|uniref:Ferritin-like domain-containing protein n=1 Tax=Acanthamoeba castellanii (strain ATCC 30010 / Neff) TaxID=1257118 RepID=L8GGQ3_ACACF|nr:uncharacterized protein ACA1_140210 [Acanthamoeba castellanii str. Neff]ELR12137.1 hypothetical protein ACA1_140210 [Acanthamoeba castellanii str. Neff]